MSDLDDVRDSFVQLWGRMSGFWGIAPTSARVYGYLISQPEPVDADAMMEGLGMSRGAVSMACRELREWGLVRSHRAPGSRRNAFEPETDLEKVVRNIVQTRKRREWDPVLESLREGIDRLRPDRSAEAASFRARLEQIESIVTSVDHMAERFLKGGTLERLGLKLILARAEKRRKGTRK